MTDEVEVDAPVIQRTVRKTWHLSKRAAFAIWRSALLLVGVIGSLSVLVLLGVGLAYWNAWDDHAGEHAMVGMVGSVVVFAIMLGLKPKKAPESHDYEGFLKQRAGQTMLTLPEGTAYTLGPAQGGQGDFCIDFVSKGARDAFLADRVLVRKGGSSVTFAHITFGGARVGENGIVIHCRTKKT